MQNSIIHSLVVLSFVLNLFSPLANAQEHSPAVARAIEESRAGSLTQGLLIEAIEIAEEQVTHAQAMLSAARTSTDHSKRELIAKGIIATSFVFTGVAFIRMLTRMTPTTTTKAILPDFALIFGFSGIAFGSFLDFSKLKPEDVAKAETSLALAELQLKQLKERFDLSESIRFASEDRAEDLTRLISSFEELESRIIEVETLIINKQNSTEERKKLSLAQDGLRVSALGFLSLGSQQFLRLSALNKPGFQTAVIKAFTSKSAKSATAIGSIAIYALSLAAVGVESPLSPKEVTELEVELRETKQKLYELQLLELKK